MWENIEILLDYNNYERKHLYYFYQNVETNWLHQVN